MRQMKFVKIMTILQNSDEKEDRGHNEPCLLLNYAPSLSLMTASDGPDVEHSGFTNDTHASIPNVHTQGVLAGTFMGGTGPVEGRHFVERISLPPLSIPFSIGYRRIVKTIMN